MNAPNVNYSFIWVHTQTGGNRIVSLFRQPVPERKSDHTSWSTACSFKDKISEDKIKTPNRNVNKQKKRGKHGPRPWIAQERPTRERNPTVRGGGIRDSSTPRHIKAASRRRLQTLVFLSPALRRPSPPPPNPRLWSRVHRSAQSTPDSRPDPRSPLRRFRCSPPPDLLLSRLLLFCLLFGVRSGATAGLGPSGGATRADLRRFGGNISDFDGSGLTHGFAHGNTTFPPFLWHAAFSSIHDFSYVGFDWFCM